MGSAVILKFKFASPFVLRKRQLLPLLMSARIVFRAGKQMASPGGVIPAKTPI